MLFSMFYWCHYNAYFKIVFKVFFLQNSNINQTDFRQVTFKLKDVPPLANEFCHTRGVDQQCLFVLVSSFTFFTFFHIHTLCQTNRDHTFSLSDQCTFISLYGIAMARETILRRQLSECGNAYEYEIVGK